MFIGMFNYKNVIARFKFYSFGLILLLLALNGCGPAVPPPPDTPSAYQRLHISTVTSSVPPSYVYCGNVNKDARGPGNCASITTNDQGRIPSFEQTEIRGWIVAGPGWAEGDEMDLNLLLDWGWTEEAGIRAINTPEKILETLTPFDILHFGVDPSSPTAGGEAILSTQTPGEAWGGPNAAVIHVEGQAWRFSDSTPSGWRMISEKNPKGPQDSQFAVDFFQPDADPPLAANIGIGTYVRIVGTQWEDTCHCQDTITPWKGADLTAHALAWAAFGRWIDGSFGHGVIYWSAAEPGERSWPLQGRGWTEIHPVDYMAVLPTTTHPTDALEVIAMAGAGEVMRSIKLPPKPSANAHVAFRKIDTPFMSLLPGDLAADEVTVTDDGIDVHIKLNARSGIAPGYPKLFRGYYVEWKE